MTLSEAYRVLELDENASLDEVKRAYKLLAAVWHPDRFGSARLKAEGEAKLKQINEAYELLTRHIESGGAGPSPGNAGPEDASETDTYIDWACFYLGNDPRLKKPSTLDRGRRPAVLRLNAEGITLATISREEVDEVVNYPANGLLYLEQSGQLGLHLGLSLIRSRIAFHTLQTSKKYRCLRVTRRVS